MDYLGDGHFCLLACIATTESPQFEGFSGTDLNANVRNLNKVAWRNIHILTVPQMMPKKMKLGDVVVSNYTARDMHAQLAFEVLDGSARPINPAGDTLLITPKGAAREKLREDYQVFRPFLEDMGHGVFRVLDIRGGISRSSCAPVKSYPSAWSIFLTGTRKAMPFAPFNSPWKARVGNRSEGKRSSLAKSKDSRRGEGFAVAADSAHG